MTESNQLEPTVLSDEIRDGLLQDLLAVGMILSDLEAKVMPGEATRITAARESIDADIATVRGLIARLSGAGAVAA